MAVGHTQKAGLNLEGTPLAGELVFDHVQVGVSASLNAAPVAVWHLLLAAPDGQGFNRMFLCASP